jgi:hypothetical protein
VSKKISISDITLELNGKEINWENVENKIKRKKKKNLAGV